MTPAELNRAIAQATGESPAEIARRGFGPLNLVQAQQEAELEALLLHWDQRSQAARE